MNNYHEILFVKKNSPCSLTDGINARDMTAGSLSGRKVTHNYLVIQYQ